MKSAFLRTALALAALGAVGTAYADPITGSITFADGFNTTATSTSIVSQLTYMDVDGVANVSGCTDAFGAGCGSGGGYAFSFDILGNGGQLVFDYGDFEFTADAFTSISPIGLSCNDRGDCTDGLSFTATGTIHSGDLQYAQTPFTMTWTAHGMCTQNIIEGPMINCGAGSISAGWTATLVATNTPVTLGDGDPIPEPGTLALLAGGFVLLGTFAFRRKV